MFAPCLEVISLRQIHPQSPNYGRAAATQGQTVKIKFDLFSHNIGGHVFDPVRAWFDANGNGQWAEAEMIFSAQYNKATNASYEWKGTPDNPGSNRQWAQGNSGDWIKHPLPLT